MDLKGFFNTLRNYMLEIIVIFMILARILMTLTGMNEVKGTITYEEFMKAVQEEHVDYIVNVLNSATVKVVFKDGTEHSLIKLGYSDFIKDIKEAGVTDIRVQQYDARGIKSQLLSSIFPIIIIYIILKSVSILWESYEFTAKRIDSNKVNNKVKFSDVAGMSEIKEELKSAVATLKMGETLKSKGMRPIKGILFEGPPGVGKTLLAKALAGEADVNFLSFSGSSFSSSFAGVGGMKVRAMYKKALESKPCVVFIDEIDSIGSKRSGRDDSASKDSNNTLNTLLEVMDGISTEEGVLFIGATNLAEHLDPALLRPGRFDKIIHIGPPNSKKDREEIVQVHLRNKQISDDLSVEKIAKLCFGLTGAQIEAALNDAVMESILDGKDGVIHYEHMDRSVMKLLTNSVANGRHPKNDLKRVAVHEVGHAMMNQKLGRRVIKVSVVPYSNGVGGVTVVDNDSIGSTSLRSKSDLIGDIKVLYAGMAAEEVVFGESSTGSSSDLEKATQLIDHMVSTWGMAEGHLINIDYFNKKGVLINHEERLNYMERFANNIYFEVKSYFEQEEVKSRLIKLAEELEEKEVIYDFNV